MTKQESAPLIFILGGARSGKSDYALELAHEMAGEKPVLFIATAQAGDDELAERIERHRGERPPHWQTLEAPLQVGEAWQRYVANADVKPAVAVLDCVTLLVSNAMFIAGGDAETEPEVVVDARVRAEIDALVQAQRDLAQPLIIVSNEVGLGIVPLGRISRLYRDLIGRANRRLAAAADQPIFMLAGIPLDLGRMRIGKGRE